MMCSCLAADQPCQRACGCRPQHAAAAAAHEQQAPRSPPTRPAARRRRPHRAARPPVQLALRFPDLAAAAQHALLHPFIQLLSGQAEAQQVQAPRRVHSVGGADGEERADAEALPGRRGRARWIGAARRLVDGVSSSWGTERAEEEPPGGGLIQPQRAQAGHRTHLLLGRGQRVERAATARAPPLRGLQRVPRRASQAHHIPVGTEESGDGVIVGQRAAVERRLPIEPALAAGRVVKPAAAAAVASMLRGRRAGEDGEKIGGVVIGRMAAQQAAPAPAARGRRLTAATEGLRGPGAALLPLHAPCRGLGCTREGRWRAQCIGRARAAGGRQQSDQALLRACTVQAWCATDTAAPTSSAQVDSACWVCCRCHPKVQRLGLSALQATPNTAAMADDPQQQLQGEAAPQAPPAAPAPGDGEPAGGADPASAPSAGQGAAAGAAGAGEQTGAPIDAAAAVAAAQAVAAKLMAAGQVRRGDCKGLSQGRSPGWQVPSARPRFPGLPLPLPLLIAEFTAPQFVGGF